MSLEQAVQENTAALRELIAVMQSNATEAHDARAFARTAEMAKPLATHAPEEKPKAEKPKAEEKPKADEEVVTFLEMRTEFRKLVGVNRDAAVEILGKYGLKKLDEDNQPTSDHIKRILADVNAELAKHG